MTKKFLLLASLVVLFVALGFFRQFTFVNINYHLVYLFHNEEVSHMSSFFDFLLPLSYYQLYSLKWVLTLLFSTAFGILTCAVIWIWFRERKLVIYTIYAFTTLLGIAALLFGGGYLLGDPHQGYALARIFMGYAQSPVVAMVLIPAFKLVASQKPLSE